MSNVRKLHNEAMKLTISSMNARYNGKFTNAKKLARKAYEYESQAANLVPCDKSSEPTRSILYRSAASLAYQCNEFDSAEYLIKQGLSEHTSEQHREEFLYVSLLIKIERLRMKLVRILPDTFEFACYRMRDNENAIQKLRRKIQMV